MVKGIIHSLVPGRGAVVSLAHGKRGMISVTDFTDNYDDSTKEGVMEVGDYVKCVVVRPASSEKGYCALSCRKSRSVLWLRSWKGHDVEVKVS